MFLRLAVCLLVPAFSGLADLTEVEREQNLEKRSSKALDYASQAIDRGRTAYKANQFPEFEAALHEVEAAVELCQTSLEATGKSARRSPKYFKRAEMKIREILKRLNALSTETGFDDRQRVAKVSGRLNEIHDQLFEEIMAGKKRK